MHYNDERKTCNVYGIAGQTNTLKIGALISTKAKHLNEKQVYQKLFEMFERFLSHRFSVGNLLQIIFAETA